MASDDDSLYNSWHKHPESITSRVFEAARRGKLETLHNYLEQMNYSERATVLETRTLLGWLFLGTPLFIACAGSRPSLDCVDILLAYKADIEARGNCRVELGLICYDVEDCTPLFAAAVNSHDRNYSSRYRGKQIVRRLVESGADVNTRAGFVRNEYGEEVGQDCTVLMIASYMGDADMVAYLVDQGANVDLTDKQGNTALHYAVEGLGNSDVGHDDHDCFKGHQFEVVKELLAGGASQLHNAHRLTPVLLASNNCETEIVEYFLKRPDCEEHKIDALELLGASVATVAKAAMHSNCLSINTEEAFKFMKRGMEGRFQDPSHPLVKQVMGPVEAYDNKRESQTLEELALIEGDNHAIIMEGLAMRERILGTRNEKLICPLAEVSEFYFKKNSESNLCFVLREYAMEIAKECRQPMIDHLEWFLRVFSKMVDNNSPPRPELISEVFDKAVFDYKTQKEKLQFAKLNEQQQEEIATTLNKLCHYSRDLLIIYCKTELQENAESSCVKHILQEFLSLNPTDDQGDTLLHLAASLKPIQATWGRYYTLEEPVNGVCGEAVKLILSAGGNVNALNSKGDTPLHILAAATVKFDQFEYIRAGQTTFKPIVKDLDVLTDMLEVLLHGSAHHDFVNNNGKKALDLAETDEARSLLSGIIRLECISARAVKQFGIPYIGAVSKQLEIFIRRH